MEKVHYSMMLNCSEVAANFPRCSSFNSITFIIKPAIRVFSDQIFPQEEEEEEASLKMEEVIIIIEKVKEVVLEKKY